MSLEKSVNYIFYYNKTIQNFTGYGQTKIRNKYIVYWTRRDAGTANDALDYLFK